MKKLIPMDLITKKSECRTRMEEVFVKSPKGIAKKMLRDKKNSKVIELKTIPIFPDTLGGEWSIAAIG